MKVALVINPVSGAGREGSRLKELLVRLRSAGIEYVQQTTNGPGCGQLLAHDAGENADAVIAVGGDGTVREIAEGLIDSKTPLLIWPRGTENLVARSLGFRRDPEHMIQCLRNGTVRPLDMGIANGQSFMVVAGIGFDAEVVDRLVRLRRGHITHLSYAGPLWRSFWEHRWPELKITAETPDGPTAWATRGMVFVGNMPRYSLGLQVVRDAVPDDGLLDLVAMRCHGRLAQIGHSLRTVLRTHIEHADVFHHRVIRLHISSDRPVPVEIDGEYAGQLPLDIAIRPAAIRVKVPPSVRSR